MQPKSPCGFTIRGLALFINNRKDEALANLDRAAQDADFRPARLHRGYVFLLEKDYAQALQDFQRRVIAAWRTRCYCRLTTIAVRYN